LAEREDLGSNILQAGPAGTIIVAQAPIPAEAYYLGWQESLILLATLVEAEIPD
jgi:hypothetical protein